MPLPRLALLAGASALALAGPAEAQHQGHQMMPGMPMPSAKTAPPKKAPATKRKAPTNKPAAKAGASRPGTGAKKPAPAGKPAAKPDTGHDMSSMPGMDGHEGHDTPEAHEGHDMGSMPASAGMEAAGTDLEAGDAPPPPVPTDHAADRVYGPEAMEMGRHHLSRFHGGQKFAQVFVNIAEYQLRKGRNGYEWQADAWYGGDIDRLWLKSEGGGRFGQPVERAEVQALFSHAIGPYFNLHGGLRYDFKPNPSRAYAILGLEGLAPSFFDVEGALFLSNKGELMARAEGYYDQRITQRLILQPRAELNFAAQNSRSIGIGSGLSDAEIGLRLRYDIRREFAPYLGVQYSRAFGKTRRYLRDAGEGPGGWQFVAGIRTWF